MIADFLGRLHPALVHLPIGILLLAVLFELLTRRNRFANLRLAVPVMVFWGMIAAIASAISGLALESSGDYEEDLLNPHKWAGLALAALSIVLYMSYKRSARKFIKVAAFCVLILIFLTGHLGGSLTHGEDFLSFSGDEEERPIDFSTIPDMQQAVVYTDLVQPIFEARCYSCHSSRKQKGKLRLDEQDFIMRGGESGNTIVAGKPEQSELIERLLLPPEDDDHMPPPRKPQLTREQVEIVKWWVSSGADFHKKVSELQPSEQVNALLQHLQSGSTVVKEKPDLVPAAPVEAADAAAISGLTDAGVSIVPVARGSNYLSAAIVNKSVSIDSVVTLLPKLKKQLISLRIDGVLPGKEAMQMIGAFSGLRKLQLSNMAVSDESITSLSNLKELRSLNLVGTSVTLKGLSQLSGLQQLENLYVYKSGVVASDSSQLKTLFPKTQLDLGNYVVPTFQADTQEIKLP